jgi:hypothetical protein
MIFISAQPHDIYFLWQVEVQACNFRKHGVSDKMHVLVWMTDNDLRAQRGEEVEDINMEGWVALAKKYPEVKFSFYKDKGLTVPEFNLYIPQLRPQILAKHFDLHPELKSETIFYHDSDIIFNRLPLFSDLGPGEVNWTSNTSHYLDYSYLRRKEIEGNIPEEEAIKALCDIGRVPVELFKSMDGNNGGAQYVLKNIDGDFWRDVEQMSIAIRTAFTHKDEGNVNRHPELQELLSQSINTKYFPHENAGFQSWCADMWAVNFAIWNRGREVQTTPLLDFSWATDSAETYKAKPIFHNAGATGTQDGVFYKGAWIMKSPIGKPLTAKKSTASWFYVEAIREASRITS